MLLSLTVLLLFAGDPQAQQAPEAKEKLICRREVPIGSLIATRKICLTKAQWTRREQDGNEQARKMMLDNMGKCFDPGQCPG
jgi:hypothetical protein